MFDIQLQVVNATLDTADNHLDLQYVVALTVPQENGTAALPVGIIRIPTGKQMAISLGQQLIEKGEELPDPPKKSDLVIPENAAEVAEAENVGS